MESRAKSRGRHKESDTVCGNRVIDPWTTRRAHVVAMSGPPRSQRHRGHRPTHTLTFARPWEHYGFLKNIIGGVLTAFFAEGGKVHISSVQQPRRKTTTPLTMSTKTFQADSLCWTLWRRPHAWNRPGHGYGSPSSSTAPMHGDVRPLPATGQCTGDNYRN